MAFTRGTFLKCGDTSKRQAQLVLSVLMAAKSSKGAFPDYSNFCYWILMLILLCQSRPLGEAMSPPEGGFRHPNGNGPAPEGNLHAAATQKVIPSPEGSAQSGGPLAPYMYSTIQLQVGWKE